MRYALLSFVPLSVLPLVPPPRAPTPQMAPIRLKERPALSPGYRWPGSEGYLLPDRCHSHKLLPPFKTALTFRSSVSSSAREFPRRLHNPSGLLPLANTSTGGVRSQLAEDASSELLLHCKLFIPRIFPMTTSF